MAKICINCQADNRDIAKYCLKCGATLTVTPTQIPNAPKFCVYHPQVLAQVFCSDCGSPICLTCARYAFQSVHCPTCHMRRHVIYQPPPYGAIPWIPYPAFQHHNRKYLT